MATTKKGIYYPDNYSSSADVPADMQEMARSINKLFEENDTKNTAQDTKIEENIKDIQTLQQDNTTNKEKLEELKNKNTEQDTIMQNNAEDIIELQKRNTELEAENSVLKSQIPSRTGKWRTHNVERQ